jgi:predicted RNA-binding protein YlqC (UPF0109 family)
MTELLIQIIRHIVAAPDQVRVNAVQQGRDAVTLQIEVAPEDIGKVIGREGRIINALRLLVRAGAGRRYQKVSVELLNSDAGKQPSEEAQPLEA